MRRRAIELVQAPESVLQLLLHRSVIGTDRQGALVDGAGGLGQFKIFFQVLAETAKQRGRLRRLRQLDEHFLLPDVQRDGVDGRGRQRFATASGALLDLGILEGVLGLLPFNRPDLFDRAQDHLQGLERIDRLLVEAKDEKLPPMPHFRGVALNLA